MDLLPDARQEALAARARTLVAETSGPELWAAWATNGWFDGSAESTITDHALRFRELGRALVPGPYLATVLAARMAAAAADADVETLDDIHGGRAVVAFATAPHRNGPTRVFDRPGSTYILILGLTGAVLVDADALPAGHQVECLDPAVEVETVVAHEERVILTAATGTPYLEAAVLVAALASGIAEAALEASTEFAKVREQFGKPIGTFQAVKHRCADMAILAEAAWCQTAYAALCADARRPDAGFQAHTAKVVAADAAIRNAGANIQNHGAVGCTVENDAHLFVKRAWVLEQLGGTSREHLAALLDCPPPE